MVSKKRGAKVSKHKKISVCPHCGKKHSKSQHASHGKGSFNEIHLTRTLTKSGKIKKSVKTTAKKKGLTKTQFLAKMNKGRKAKGLPLIKARK